jgi:hypothetical protein
MKTPTRCTKKPSTTPPPNNTASGSPRDRRATRPGRPRAGGARSRACTAHGPLRSSRLDRNLERGSPPIHVDQDRRRDPRQHRSILSTNFRRGTLDALGPAVFDHHRRGVGRDDGEAVLLEVGAVLPGAGADLQQPRARRQPVTERLPPRQLPRLLSKPLTSGRVRVVRLAQRAGHLVTSDRHVDQCRRAGWSSVRRPCSAATAATAATARSVRLGRPLARP